MFNIVLWRGIYDSFIFPVGGAIYHNQCWVWLLCNY